MSDFLSKPFRTPELSDMLARWLPGQSGRQATSTLPAAQSGSHTGSPAHAQTGAPAAATTATPAAPDAIDEHALGSMRESFGEDFDEVLDTFLDDAPDLLSRLRECLAGDARDELARHAHSLKSAARSFSLTRVAALAESLEKAAHSDAVIDLSARIKALDQAYAEDCGRLRALCGRGPAPT